MDNHELLMMILELADALEVVTHDDDRPYTPTGTLIARARDLVEAAKPSNMRREARFTGDTGRLIVAVRAMRNEERVALKTSLDMAKSGKWYPLYAAKDIEHLSASGWDVRAVDD